MPGPRSDRPVCSYATAYITHMYIILWKISPSGFRPSYGIFSCAGLYIPSKPCYMLYIHTYIHTHRYIYIYIYIYVYIIIIIARQIIVNTMICYTYFTICEYRYVSGEYNRHYPFFRWFDKLFIQNTNGGWIVVLIEVTSILL